METTLIESHAEHSIYTNNEEHGAIIFISRTFVHTLLVNNFLWWNYIYKWLWLEWKYVDCNCENFGRTEKCANGWSWWWWSGVIWGELERKKSCYESIWNFVRFDLFVLSWDGCEICDDWSIGIKTGNKVMSYVLDILPWCRRLNVDQFSFRWAHINYTLDYFLLFFSINLKFLFFIDSKYIRTMVRCRWSLCALIQFTINSISFLVKMSNIFYEFDFKTNFCRSSQTSNNSVGTEKTG